jgi:chorismate mutase
MDITDWRNRIDEVDAQLVKLLNERAQCAIEIGKIKRANKLTLYDPEREAQIIRNALANNPGPLNDEAIQRLFERIIDESRRLERLAIEQAVR